MEIQSVNPQEESVLRKIVEQEEVELIHSVIKECVPTYNRKENKNEVAACS